MTQFDRPKSLTELVTENIRNRIVTGELELNEQISEARIAGQLKVSRTPVREAINRLEMEGLLIVEPQRGSFVFDLGSDELAKLCDARICLETAALGHALDDNPKGLLAALQASTERMTDARNSDDVAGYLAEDTVFHQCFFDCADNRFLNDAYQTISLKMAALRNRLGRHPDHMAKSYQEHLSILDSVRQGRKQEALKILRAHIGRKEGSYWNDATSGEYAVESV